MDQIAPYWWVLVLLPFSYLAGYFIARRQVVEDDIRSIHALRESSPEVFASADRVLSFDGAPEMVRQAILILLTALTKKGSASEFVLRGARGLPAPPPDAPSIASDLAALRCTSPEMADEASRAILGLILIVAAIGHASREDVAVVQREVALHPGNMLARIQSAIPA